MSETMTPQSFTKVFLLLLCVCTADFIQGQTLLTASLNTPGNSGIMSENCPGPYELVLRRGPDNDSSTEIFISGEGTATIGVDYEFEPGTIPATMLPTDTVLIIPITVTNDGNVEGLESVLIQIAFLAGLESGDIMLETSITDAYTVEIESPASDTIIWCRDIPYVLLADSDAEEIFWSPAEFFDDSLGTSATVRPFESGWYYASVGTDACGASDSVYFDLAIVEIQNDDTVYICLDENGVILLGNIEGLATEFTWIPSDSTLSDTNILNPLATPTVTTTYILQSDIGVCTASDRVVVRVDSIPFDLHIDIAPSKPYYCAGEVVALFSPSFDTLLFPDITFMWGPNDGTFISPLTLLNAALSLRDTTWYFRENTNNACSSRDSILINVVPPGVPLSVTDTMLCPGEMFIVEVLSDEVTDPEWSPKEGLSCTKCLAPKVTVLGTPGSLLTYQFAGMIKECPVGASLQIQIPPQLNINIVGDQIVCEGEMIQLTITNPTGLSNFNWDVNFGNASLSCDDCPNPVVTINSTNDPINLIVTADSDNEAFCGAFGFIQLNSGVEPQLPPSVIFACLGETVIATTGHPDFTDVVWTVLGGSLSLSCSICPNPVVTVNSTGRLHYFAEVSGPDTCRVSGVVEVNIAPRDQVTFTTDPPLPIAQGTDVVVTLNVNPLPLNAMWIVNGASIPSTATSIEFNANEQLNFIEVTFINSNGCVQIDTFSFPTVPPSYQIPNAFSPNGDALNDNFRIKLNGNVEIAQFLIFNRWGQLVFEAPDGDMMGWNGQFKEKPAASDTYVYTARLRFPDGREEVAKGDVALLR